MRLECESAHLSRNAARFMSDGACPEGCEHEQCGGDKVARVFLLLPHEKKRRPEPDILEPNTIDTIYVELSAEEVKALSCPPRAAAPHASLDRAPDVDLSRRSEETRRITLLVSIALVTASVGTLGYFARASVPAPETNTRTRFNIQTPTAAPESPPSESSPVGFANPFDKTEVFEFPAGTGKEAAQDAVAEILLKRAEERRYRRLRAPKTAPGQRGQ
jgi:hypothetical protein